jgi:hypothetical protein
MRAAEARGDSERAERLQREILTLIRRGGGESLAWKDVERWIARKTRTTETDARIAATKGQMISVEEMMALTALILSAIRRHVPDQSVRKFGIFLAVECFALSHAPLFSVSPIYSVVVAKVIEVLFKC